MGKWEVEKVGNMIKLSRYNGDESGALIIIMGKSIELYEIPQYGGMEMVVGPKETLLQAMLEAESWT